MNLSDLASIPPITPLEAGKVGVAAGVPGTVNPACGVHGPIPCEGAQCICASGVAIPLKEQDRG